MASNYRSRGGAAKSEAFAEAFTGGLKNVAHQRRLPIDAVKRDIYRQLTKEHPGEARPGLTPSTPDRWSRGYIPNDPQDVAWLARYIRRYTFLDRRWFEKFLSAGRYPFSDAQHLLDELFERKDEKRTMLRRHNLPQRPPTFVGRDADRARLLDALASRYPVISLEGLSGAGKSTLAVEVAYQCLEHSGDTLTQMFDFIVWLSGKEPTDTPADEGAARPGHWRAKAMDTIAHVLGQPYIQRLPRDEKPFEVDDLLGSHRVLLILDDYDSMPDPALEQWMLNVPEPSKVLLTTKRSAPHEVKRLLIQGLEQEDAVKYARAFASRRGLERLAAAAPSVLIPLARETSGNPKAIELALGHVERGRPLNEVVDDLFQANQSASDIFDALFDWAWNQLDEDARRVGMALPLFGEEIPQDAIRAASGLESYHLDYALEQLVDLSLLERLDTDDYDLRSSDTLRSSYQLRQTGEQYYTAHTLMRGFASQRLAQNPEWETEARQRWLGWYLDFTQRYGGQDGARWGERYAHIEHEWPTIEAVLRWSAEHDPHAYEHLGAFWDRGHLEVFADVRGHWDARIQAANWLIEQASARDGEERRLSYALHLKVWLLMLRGRMEDLHAADSLLARAWALRSHSAPVAACQVAEEFAYLRICQYRECEPGDPQHLREALESLGQEAEQLEILAPTHGETAEFLRTKIRQIYYSGHVYFWLGTLDDLDRAQALFEEVIALAPEVYPRAENYAMNWLADVALKRYDADTSQMALLDLAATMVTEGSPVAEENGDTRRAAYFKYTGARIAFRRGDLEAARRTAEEALDLFQRLGMWQEAGKVKLFFDPNAIDQ